MLTFYPNLQQVRHHSCRLCEYVSGSDPLVTTEYMQVVVEGHQLYNVVRQQPPTFFASRTGL